MLTKIFRDISIGSDIAIILDDGKRVPGVLICVCDGHIILDHDGVHDTIHENLIMAVEHGTSWTSEFDIAPSVALPGERDSSIQEIKSLIFDARTLTICDPYFFNKPRELTDNEYTREIMSILPFETLLYIDIFHNGTHPVDIERKFKNKLRKYPAKLRLFKNKLIHDRIWIVNANKAFIIGTSFGGIGSKFSFILEVPDDDLRELKRFLHKIRNPAQHKDHS